MAERRRPDALPLTAGVLALLVAALFLLDDLTAVDITAEAAWPLALLAVGAAGLALAVRRARSS